MPGTMIFCRCSADAKRAFLALCRRAHLTQSEVIRALVTAWMREQSTEIANELLSETKEKEAEGKKP